MRRNFMVPALSLWLALVGLGPITYAQGASLHETLQLSVATKATWSEFLDDGGLNSDNVLYGVPIFQIDPKFDAGGVLKGYNMVTNPRLSSPKKIREALSTLCGFVDTDWTYDAEMGEGKSGGTFCSYIVMDANTCVMLVGQE